MEKSRKLYPFIIKGASLDSQSEISNGFLEGNTLEDAIDTYMMDILGLEVFKYFRGEFPLVVSQKHVKDFTPVMVCPGDESSIERYGVPGNIKMWYVKDAASTAKIVFGLRREATATELFEACHKGILEDYLQVIRPQAGDFILIPPGVMHAIGGDIEYVEVATACGANYHLYDVNPAEKVKIYANMAYSGYPYDPELFEAIDLIDYRPASLAENYLTTLHSDTRMVSWPLHFVVKYAVLSESVKVLPAIAGSFIAYVGLKGNAQIRCGEHSYPLPEGALLLVPSVIDDYDLEPASESATAAILEIYIPPIDLECDAPEGEEQK